MTRVLYFRAVSLIFLAQRCTLPTRVSDSVRGLIKDLPVQLITTLSARHILPAGRL